MKRVFYLLCLVSLSYSAFAQNCDGIKTKTVTESGNQFYNSPISETVAFTKMISGSDTTFYLRVELPGSIAVEDAKGAVIFLDDSDPMKYKDAELQYRYRGGKHTYTLTQRISAYDLVLYSLYKIVSVKLYLFQEDIPAELQERYQTFASCIFSSKNEGK